VCVCVCVWCGVVCVCAVSGIATLDGRGQNDYINPLAPNAIYICRDVSTLKGQRANKRGGGGGI